MGFQSVSIFLCLSLSASAAMADAFQFSRILPVGGHYEQCLKVDAGHSLGWRFGASQSLAFNVHSHPDDEIVYHVRNETGSDEGSFQSPRSGVYCVMWENNSQQPSDLEGILTPAR